MTSLIKVGSYNLAQWSNDEHAGRALQEFSSHVHLAGLQEFGGPTRRHYLETLHGFGFLKPSKHPTAPAIIWDRSVFRLIHGHSEIVAPARDVNHVFGRRDHLPDYWATLARLEYLPTGGHVAFGDVHTPAHVEFWPGPRRAMYKETVHNTIMALHPGLPTWVSGDWNWRLHTDALPVREMRKHGLENMWEHHTPVGGTEGNRVIDGVFSNINPVVTRILRGITVGDHFAVVGEYPARQVVNHQ